MGFFLGKGGGILGFLRERGFFHFGLFFDGGAGDFFLEGRVRRFFAGGVR